MGTIIPITPDRAATRRARAAWKGAASLHPHKCVTSAPPGGILSSVKNAHVATPNAANITPGPTMLTAPRPDLAPKNRLNTTPSAGNSRISASAGNSTVIGSSSPSHQGQVVGVHGFTIAENRNDDAQTARRF